MKQLNFPPFLSRPWHASGLPSWLQDIATALNYLICTYQSQWAGEGPSLWVNDLRNLSKECHFFF